MTKFDSNPYASGPATADPLKNFSGVDSRNPVLWWFAGTCLPAVITALSFLIDYIAPSPLPVGPTLLTLMFAWLGGWIVASVASFHFKKRIPDEFALCFIASILMLFLMFAILFVGISITGDLGR